MEGAAAFAAGAEKINWQSVKILLVYRLPSDGCVEFTWDPTVVYETCYLDESVGTNVKMNPEKFYCKVDATGKFIISGFEDSGDGLVGNDKTAI